VGGCGCVVACRAVPRAPEGLGCGVWVGAGVLWLVAQFPAPLKGWVAVCGWVWVGCGLSRSSPRP